MKYDISKHDTKLNTSFFTRGKEIMWVFDLVKNTIIIKNQFLKFHLSRIPNELEH